MPAFVFWASFIIFLLFFGASVALLWQSHRLAHVFMLVAKRVQKIPPSKTGKMSVQELKTIREIMEKQPLIYLAWREFEDTLLVSPQGEEIYSTQGMDEALSKAALIEENIHTALFNAIPGILTGVGLLMTFVAILDGLSHVSVGANMDVKGIGGLINGLSGKFVSSIVAVTCAVLFVFVERIAYSRPNDAYRKLIANLNARFKRKTTEHLLFSIITQLQGKSSSTSERTSRGA